MASKKEEEEMTPYYQLAVEVQAPHSALVDTKSYVLIVALGDGSLGSTCGLHQHHT